MKKIIFIISITLLAFNSQAQGTLQFNQVLTFATDTSFIVTDYNKNDLRTWDIYTVPNNRVVKITKAINVQNGGGSYCSVNSLYYTINGINTTKVRIENVFLIVNFDKNKIKNIAIIRHIKFNLPSFAIIK
jgi:uncharacterized protein YutD